MSSNLLRYSTYRLGVALLLATPLMRGTTAAAADAPTVGPAAPIVDKPLTPAANDTPGDQPSPQDVWVPGHWRWFEGAYVWEAGRWEVPPAPNMMWIAPQWQPQGNGYILKEGYWDEAPVPVDAAAPAMSQEIATAEPPPPPQREIVNERPSGQYVWIPGYWAWRDSRYNWVAGHWEIPPRPNAAWVQPRWEQRGNRYVFVQGYWRDASAVAIPAPMSPATQQVVVAPQASPAPVVVVTAPPPPRHEVVVGRPSPYHIWIDGYWAWRGGRHVWIAGHWERPPRGYRNWIAPRWERSRGGGYVFIEGHWGR